jgi:hypothetical protein
MLAEMEPAEMDERIAAELVDGDPVERIATILKLGFAALCCPCGGTVNPELFDPPRRLTNSSRPGTSRSVAASDREPILSPAQAAAMMHGTLGPPNRR